MLPLPQRQQQVLQATVQHYVDTVEPVGSRTLVRRFGLDASPATVRSAMGALEQKGLLIQPHTSAGRVPSAKGYRHYVDCLLPEPGAAALQLQRELAELSLQWAALEDLLQHLARRLADLTGLLSVITRPQRPQPQLKALRLVVSGDRLLVFLVESSALSSSLNLRLPPVASSQLEALERWLNLQLQVSSGAAIPWGVLPSQLQAGGAPLQQALESHNRARNRLAEGALTTGLTGLLAQPEFSLTTSLRPLLQLVEQSPHELLSPSDAAALGGVWIGGEHPNPALDGCAVVQASYHSRSGAQGQVALVGPMRMAYATARAAVQSVAGSLSRLLS